MSSSGSLKSGASPGTSDTRLDSLGMSLANWIELGESGQREKISKLLKGQDPKKAKQTFEKIKEDLKKAKEGYHQRIKDARAIKELEDGNREEIKEARQDAKEEKARLKELIKELKESEKVVQKEAVNEAKFNKDLADGKSLKIAGGSIKFNEDGNEPHTYTFAMGGSQGRAASAKETDKDEAPEKNALKPEDVVKNGVVAGDFNQDGKLNQWDVIDSRRYTADDLAASQQVFIDLGPDVGLSPVPSDINNGEVVLKATDKKTGRSTHLRFTNAKNVHFIFTSGIRPEDRQALKSGASLWPPQLLAQSSVGESEFSLADEIAGLTDANAASPENLSFIPGYSATKAALAGASAKVKQAGDKLFAFMSSKNAALTASTLWKDLEQAGLGEAEMRTLILAVAQNAPEVFKSAMSPALGVYETLIGSSAEPTVDQKATLLLLTTLDNQSPAWEHYLAHGSGTDVKEGSWKDHAGNREALKKAASLIQGMGEALSAEAKAAIEAEEKTLAGKPASA